MSEIVRLCDVRKNREITQKPLFQSVVDDYIRDDFLSKKVWLQSIGCRSVLINEALDTCPRGNGHIMVMFTGTGLLDGFSFAFVVRNSLDCKAIRAEVFVMDTAGTTLMSKEISSILLTSYTNAWLHDCYSAAMKTLAPVTENTHLASHY